MALLNRITEIYRRLFKTNSTATSGLRDHLDKAIDEDGTTEFFIDVDKDAENYMHALKRLLQKAASEVLVFIDKVDQTLADGTTLLSNDEILSNVIGFLNRNSNNVLKVVVRQNIVTGRLLKKHRLFADLGKLSGLELYWAHSESVGKCESKIVIVDRKAYSFRVHKYAWINANSPEKAKSLAACIEKAIMLSDTCVFDKESFLFLREKSKT